MWQRAGRTGGSLDHRLHLSLTAGEHLALYDLRRDGGGAPPEAGGTYNYRSEVVEQGVGHHCRIAALYHLGGQHRFGRTWRSPIISRYLMSALGVDISMIDGKLIAATYL